MNDPIEDLVNASLERGQQHGHLGLCPHKGCGSWHGLARNGCPGSHVPLDDKKIAAIESQGVIDYEMDIADYIFRGEN